MGTTPAEFIEECLQIHNKYRTLHGSPPLEIDEKLNDFAQTRAMCLAEKDYVSQRKEIPYGENVYTRPAKDPDFKIKAEEAVQAWYKRNQYYNYDSEPDTENLLTVQKFTQLIWKETKSIGVATTSCEGKVYVVCIYDPAGNTQGQFANNVLPPEPEEEPVIAPPDEMSLKYTETNVDIVQSMERIYSVPSEKIRVWSIWLSKIGSEADEWQKWLRLHIDFVIRLMTYLQMAEQAIAEETNVHVTPQETEVPDVGVSTDTDGEMGQLEVLAEVPDDQEVEKSVQAEDSAAILMDDEKGTEEAAAEDTAIETSENANEETAEAEQTEFPVNSETQESEEKAETAITESPSGSEDKEGEKYAYWPIGIPWQPLGYVIEEEKKPDAIEILEIPNDENKMLEFIKNFTHQATIYMTYFKHWNDTADQAIKEIVGRMVVSTSKLRAYDEARLKKILPSKEKIEQIGETTASIEDMARADENIPYFFYLKADADIGIAIENDDEKVITHDEDREKISADRKYIYFNIADKPGKGD